MFAPEMSGWRGLPCRVGGFDLWHGETSLDLRKYPGHSRGVDVVDDMDKVV